MNRNDIETAINNLRVNHKIFHSEADFKFSLAWELQKILPDAKIRLEYCPLFDDSMHIDIYVLDEGHSYPIELKYKTKEIKMPIDGEHYNLKNQFAHDIGRYDFLYDISRIEKAKTLDENFELGFAIIPRGVLNASSLSTSYASSIHIQQSTPCETVSEVSFSGSSRP